MSQSHSSDKTAEQAQRIAAQAAEWIVRLDDQPDEQTLKAYQTWLAQDPRHAEAIQRLQQLIGSVEQLTVQYENLQVPKQILQQALTSTQQRSTRKLPTKTLFSVVLAIGFGIFWALQYAPLDYWTADTRNRSQSWQQHRLSDQTQIQIAGKGAYNLQYNAQQRLVQLLQGAILVDVAKDAARPFIIQTEHVQIKALGTRFMVTHTADQTVLTMLESRVELQSTQQSQAPIVVGAGQQIRINAAGFVEDHPTPINPQLFEQAWQQHILVANGESVVEILDILALYYDGKLSFDRTALASLKLTATLPLDQVDESLEILAKELNLKLNNSVPFYIKISKKP